MFENPTNNDKKLVSALTLYKVNSYNQITITNSTIISIKKQKHPATVKYMDVISLMDKTGMVLYSGYVN